MTEPRKEQRKSFTIEELKDKRSNNNFIHNASPKIGRRPRPGNQSTGSGGAPKF